MTGRPLPAAACPPLPARACPLAGGFPPAWGSGSLYDSLQVSICNTAIKGTPPLSYSNGLRWCVCAQHALPF